MRTRPLYPLDPERDLSVLPRRDAESPTDEALPGALHGVVTLTLETHQAQRLVKGRSGSAGKPAIVGLIGFAKRLRAIWHGARADDPYADWWLVQIEDAFSRAETTLESVSTDVQRTLDAIDAIGVTPSTSIRPMRTPLRFSNPYAYRAARLLAAYDRIVRSVLTAQHIGSLTRDRAQQVLFLIGREVRRALVSPLGYRNTGISRTDAIKRNTTWLQAEAEMGEVPVDILSGARRPAYTPKRSLAEMPAALRPAVPTV